MKICKYQGNLEEGKPVKLARNENTSPKFLESHSEIDDLIMFKSFNNNIESDRLFNNDNGTDFMSMGKRDLAFK